MKFHCNSYQMEQNFDRKNIDDLASFKKVHKKSLCDPGHWPTVSYSVILPYKNKYRWGTKFSELANHHTIAKFKSCQYFFYTISIVTLVAFEWFCQINISLNPSFQQIAKYYTRQYLFLYGIFSMLEITVGHFLTNFNIWLTKIHFGRPILLYIINEMAINNLQNVLSSKNGQPISDPYFYHCI